MVPSDIDHTIDQLRRQLKSLQHSEEQVTQPDLVPTLRSALLKITRLAHDTDQLLQKSIKVEQPSTRTGHLRNLAELIGMPPYRSWTDEWDQLYVENLKLIGAWKEGMDQAWVAENEPISKWQVVLSGDISQMMNLGATQEEATAYTLLAARRFALALALRERSPRFAASEYALCRAICALSERQAHLPLVNLYYNLVGKNSLATSDPQWETLIEEDSAGFRGLCCSALVAADVANGDHHFTRSGFAVYNRTADGVEFVPQDSPVVMFEAAPPDEFGQHAPVMIKDGIYGKN